MNLLIPRNIDGRSEKLRQQNLKLFQQEAIIGNLTFTDNNTFFFSKKETKLRLIDGDVFIYTFKIPEFLRGVKVTGVFRHYIKNHIEIFFTIKRIDNGYIQ